MRTRLTFSIAAAVAVATLAPPPALAQARRAPAASAAKAASTGTSDEESIRKQAEQFAAAFNKGDAPAIAAGWTEQCEYYEESGVAIQGRQGIEDAYTAFFAAHPGARIDLAVTSIRFPSRDLALEEGVSTVTYPGPELPSTSRYLAIHVREDGKWITAVGREWGGTESKLQDLAWLAGKWSATSPAGETHINFEFNAGKTALTGTFETIVAGKTVATGHQRIILDPQSGQIHSWMFDDEGGHGEANWTHDGNKWLLDSSGIAPDGTATAATNVITRLNNDEFMWRSVNRAAGENFVAPTDPIKLTRDKASK
jgi:uncharacterized protein (TIGR02246 family)